MKRSICIVLTLLLLVAAIPQASGLTIIVGPTPEKPIGPEGSDLTWTLSEDGVLTISGTGEMIRVNQSNKMPWSSHPEDVRELVVTDGITYLSSWAFYHCKNLTKITLPDSIQEIGSRCFEDCAALREAVIPASCTELHGAPFVDCVSLESIVSRSPYFPVENGVLYNRDRTRILATVSTLTGTFVIPDGIEEADFGLTNLLNVEQVVLPDSMTVYGPFLSNCMALQAYSVSKRNPRYKTVDGVLYSKSGDQLILYPFGKPGPYYSVKS